MTCTPVVLAPPVLRQCAPLFIGVVVLLGSSAAPAADYYVATNGNDSAAGTKEQPFATLKEGVAAASGGDTVWLREGTYRLSQQVTLSKSGSSDAERIRYWAFPGEHVTLDFSTYKSRDPSKDVPALLVKGSYLHLKGFEIIGAPIGKSGDHSSSAVRSEGASNNTFELLDIHHNFGPGLFISKGKGGNLILNCDSHENYDKNGSQGDGQNADGFGVHYQESGPSTIIRGCRAWLNSDDGYDLIHHDVPVTIEDSWAVQNGFADGGATRPKSGNGNGFKVGSSKKGVRHIVRNCVGWKNKSAGFYANHSSGGNTWFNNTSYKNGAAYNLLASDPNDVHKKIILQGDKRHIMKNNIGFPNKNLHMESVVTEFNSWDLKFSEDDAAFEAVVDDGFTGPRQADGSLPTIPFLRLKKNSKMIDVGTDVGLPFAGKAPDLGAYEFGLTLPTEDANGGGAADNGGGAAASGGGAADNGGATADNGGAGGTAASSNTPAGGSPTAGSAGGSRTAMGGAAAAVPATPDPMGAGAAIAGSGTSTAGHAAVAGARTGGPEAVSTDGADSGGCRLAPVGVASRSGAFFFGVLALFGWAARRRFTFL